VTGLYDSLGGDDGLKAAVAVFYARVTADPELGPYFAHVDLDRLRAHQRAFLMAAFDGPAIFTGRPLEAAHVGRGITDEHFDRLVDHLAATLGDLGSEPSVVSLVRERIEALRERVVV
jgi:hemoglobin